LFFLFSFCSSPPGSAELERVKKDFLRLRIQAPFQDSTRNLSDQKLFELSCKRNHVPCPPLLAMLKDKDPDFYAVLIGKKKSTESAPEKSSTKEKSSSGEVK